MILQNCNEQETQPNQPNTPKNCCFAANCDQKILLMLWNNGQATDKKNNYDQSIDAISHRQTNFNQQSDCCNQKQQQDHFQWLDYPNNFADCLQRLAKACKNISNQFDSKPAKSCNITCGKSKRKTLFKTISNVIVKGRQVLVEDIQKIISLYTSKSSRIWIVKLKSGQKVAVEESELRFYCIDLLLDAYESLLF